MAVPSGKIEWNPERLGKNSLIGDASCYSRDMKKVTLRPYSASDRETLQDIRKAAFAPIFQSFRAITGEAVGAVAFASADEEQAAHLDALLKQDSGSDVYVVLDGEDIAGFIAITLNPKTRVGEIGLNAVHPKHAGRGIGTRMYAFALERLQAGGMQVAEVATGGDPAHAPARRAYEKAGFGFQIPSVVMYKDLR